MLQYSEDQSPSQEHIDYMQYVSTFMYVYILSNISSGTVVVSLLSSYLPVPLLDFLGALCIRHTAGKH